MKSVLRCRDIECGGGKIEIEQFWEGERREE
jgi:hypothetical protein